MLSLLLLAALQTSKPAEQPNPFAALAVYNGTWTVRALHPFGGSGPDNQPETLSSKCTRDQAFFTCEQSINGKPLELIVFVSGDAPGQFHTKFIYPSGLSANRGDLTLSAADTHFTYLDKGQNAEGKPAQYRVENTFKDQNHILFEEYESTDDGKTWIKTNEGAETRS